MKKISLFILMIIGAFVVSAHAQSSDAPKSAVKDDAKLQKPSEQQDKRLQELEKKVASLESHSSGLGENDFRVYWDKGIRLKSGNGDFKLKIGGRLMFDGLWNRTDDELPDQQDGIEVRRARFYTAGTIYDNLEFKLQLDFAGGDADLKDAYLAFKDLPFSAVKVGHFKEPFSLDELTSSKYITFMERALPIEAFSPSRNMGIILYNTMFEELGTLAAGVFRNTDDYGTIKNDKGYNATGRLTFAPIYKNNGVNVVHLGAAYSIKDAEKDELRYRSRPEAHLLDRFVDTGEFAADYANLFGLEAATVLGPFSLQGEYIMSRVKVDNGSDPNFSGYYAQCSYWLSGEHRNYSRKKGAFGRVSPLRNLGEKGGLGAWEVCARYSALDLNDGGIVGGKLKDITLALNWHLNPNTRIMWNYVRADVTDFAGEAGVDGNADIFQTRFQVDF